MILAAPARVTVPVAASAALASLPAEPVAGVLLGVAQTAAWVRLGDEVVALLPTGSVRAPNGIEVPRALLQGLEAGAACRGDAGGFEVGDLRLQFRTSWDPRPRLPSVDPALLRERALEARSRLAPLADGGLGVALECGNAGRVLAVAERLIGCGPGLTPLGDDLLIGAAAAALLLGEVAGSRPLARLAAELAGPLDGLARERTTSLSATLLRHACRGEVDDASAALLGALCGRGDAEAALEGLLAVGHTSGRGLAAGILAAAVGAGKAR